MENSDFEFESLNITTNYRKSIICEFNNFLQGNVVEIGAGIGQITEVLLKECSHIKTLQTVEPSSKFHEQLCQKFPELSHHLGTFQTLENIEPDTIISVNVLEHIENDEQELKDYAQRLRPKKGMLCLYVPARQEAYGPIDRDFGHYRRYNKKDLKEKLEQSGFNIKKIQYRGFIGYIAWYFLFHILKKRNFSSSNMYIYDKIIFPIT